MAAVAPVRPPKQHLRKRWTLSTTRFKYFLWASRSHGSFKRRWQKTAMSQWKTWHVDGFQQRKPERKDRKICNSGTVRTALTNPTLTFQPCASTRPWFKPVAFFTQGRRHLCQMDWHAPPPGSILMPSVTGSHWRRTGSTRLANQSHVWSTRELSDSFLKKQFRYCAKGEIGYFAPKHIISALPEEGERPTKSHRKFTVDGFEKEEEEEERANPQTRRQLERMHMVFRNNLLMCTLAFPQFQQFDITKSDLDEWYDWFYGPSIAGRRPPPSEFTLLWSERNAWRQIYQLMADGSTLKMAMKTIKEDQLF